MTKSEHASEARQSDSTNWLDDAISGEWKRKQDEAANEKGFSSYESYIDHKVATDMDDPDFDEVAACDYNTERAIELRNDEWASEQTAIDAAYGM